MAHTYNDIPAAGTTLEIMIGYAYVDIPGASEFSWDGFKRAVRSPTKLSSRAVVKKPGMPDFGQLKCKVFYDPNNTVHQDLRDKLLESAADAVIDQFLLTYADGSDTPATAEIEGFVSDFSTSFTDPETGTVTADLTIEVNDVLGFTDGNPAT